MEVFLFIFNLIYILGRQYLQAFVKSGWMVCYARNQDTDILLGFAIVDDDSSWLKLWFTNVD